MIERGATKRLLAHPPCQGPLLVAEGRARWRPTRTDTDRSLRGRTVEFRRANWRFSASMDSIPRLEQVPNCSSVAVPHCSPGGPRDDALQEGANAPRPRALRDPACAPAVARRRIFQFAAHWPSPSRTRGARAQAPLPRIHFLQHPPPEEPQLSHMSGTRLGKTCLLGGRSGRERELEEKS
jgi:hypothetical protein